jgi:hypothetical protein
MYHDCIIFVNKLLNFTYGVFTWTLISAFRNISKIGSQQQFVLERLLRADTRWPKLNVREMYNNLE